MESGEIPTASVSGAEPTVDLERVESELAMELITGSITRDVVVGLKSSPPVSIALRRSSIFVYLLKESLCSLRISNPCSSISARKACNSDLNCWF